MKKIKRLVSLLMVLGAVCVATYGVAEHEEEKERIKNSDEIILELDTEKVTALSWEYEEEYLAFHKNEKWYWDEDDAFPVDEEKIEELLSLFESFGVSFVIEDVKDFAQYGLDDPICTITVQTEEETYKLQLGDFSTMDSERYVTMGDGNVYLVNEDPYDLYECTISDMILHDEIPDISEAEEIIITGAEESRIFYEKNSIHTYGDYDVYFMERGEESLPLDTPTVNAYLRTIRTLSLEDYVTYNAMEEDLTKYGISGPEYTISLTYTVEDEKTEEEKKENFILHLYQDQKETEDEVAAYAQIGESQIIYKIKDTEYEELKAVTYNDFRHEEVLTASFDKINQMDITLEEMDYTITTKGNSEGRTYFYKDEELEIGTFESAITSLSAIEFTEEMPKDKQEISLDIHLDDQNFPKITIELFRYDGEMCLAVVDGTPVSLVDRSQVVDLIEAVYAIVLK